MNGLNALRKLFGLHPMNEAPAAEAPTGAAAPATEAAPAATDVPATTLEGSSLLSGNAAMEGEAPKVDEPAKGEPEGEATEEAEKDKPDEGAPEAYAEFALPEGMEFDAAVLDDYQAIAKELNLSQDKAQDLLGKLIAMQEKQLGTPEQQMQQAEQQIIALNSRMAEECRALPGIGGEKFADSLATASRVMQQFGTPELRDVIALTGVGSHPEFFKMMVAIGSKMAPDTFEHGGEEAHGEKTAAQILFGDVFKN